MREPVCLDAEVRPVPGFPRFAVTAAGDVYGPQGRRKPCVDRYGYLYILATRPGSGEKRYRLAIHRMVLLAWVGECPPGHESRHLDGDRTNNNLSNLAWATHVENCADRREHGTELFGEDHRQAKLTERDVREIRLLRSTMSVRALARRYGVHPASVHDAATGKTWGHVDGSANGPARNTLTEADVAEMRRLWPAESIRALAARFGVGTTTAGDVVRGKSWRGVA